VSKNTRLKRKPFSFEGHEFQRAIIDDMHREMCCIKSSQLGLSESQLRKNLGFLTRNLAVTTIFTLPNDKMRDRLTQTRVKPLVDSEKVFNSLLVEKPVRHKGLFQINESFGYFTGSTEGDATSIPADMLIHDEVDLTDQTMLGLFQSRLQHSKYQIQQSFSTPTYNGYGIDALYESSDQRVYMLRCPRCNHYQEPLFHPRFLCLPGLKTGINETSDIAGMSNEDLNQLDLENSYLRCEKCSRPVDKGDVSSRSWVTKFPTRYAHGYRLGPMSTGHITIPYILRQMVKYRDADNIKGWWNTTLGAAYDNTNVRLSEADIRACMVQSDPPPLEANEPVGIGIDVGMTCHIMVGTPNKIVKFETVPARDLSARVKVLRETYRIVCGGMDMNPYTPLAEQIRDESSKIIWPFAYQAISATNNPMLIAKRNDFDEVDHYLSNRTRALDAVAGMIRSRTVSFLGYGIHQAELVEHFRGMIRIENSDTAAVWQKLVSGGYAKDHFFHAYGLLMLGFKQKSMTEFKSSEDEKTGFLFQATNLTGYGTSELNFKSRSRSQSPSALERYA
jgi:Phage terminase large subunit (GpA)